MSTEIMEQKKEFTVRNARAEELSRIMEIYAHARQFMAEHGNPYQWGPTNWPPEALIEKDIASGKCRVCTCGGRVVAAFFFDAPYDDATYHGIDGGWISDAPYGVVHRIASDGTVPGTGRYCIEWAFAECGHLRIDTHGDNLVMQSLLAKLGFTYCGIIHVEEDDMPRLAYEKV